MEQLVNDKVDVFWKGIESGTTKRGQVRIPSLPDESTAHSLGRPSLLPLLLQILVTFSEKKPKKSWFQVYVGEEDVPWEQWSVPLSPVRHRVRA